MTTECFILTRAVHFGACLLFFGVFAFDRFVAMGFSNGDENGIINYWQTRIRLFSLILLPLILLSGIFWFGLVAVTMSGQPPTSEILKAVWTQTQFGTVWEWRLIFWLVAMAFFALSIFLRSPLAFQNFYHWLQLIFGGALLGSLAWAGHGQESSIYHLGADILHLLVAGFWPTSLLPLLLLLRKLRPVCEPARTNLVISIVRRFSTLSLISVALLAATGWVNGWFLAGSFANLFGQTYGRWLLAKIILFGMAVAIGAVNLLRLKPRLSPSQNSGPAAARLRRNILIELFLATAIIIVVAVLGILPPAAR